MSLIKKPEMTDKKVAANRRNQKLSHGPATAEGKARIGAAQLRHGFYAQAQEGALRCLGEDPAHFEELLAGLRQEFTPAGTLQEELVIVWRGCLWLTDRADRSQEGACPAPRQQRGHWTRQPPARPHDAAQDDGGKSALARPLGGVLALRHHARGPGRHEETAPRGGSGRNG